MERTAIGVMRAMKSVAVGEENPAILEKEIVTRTQNVRDLWFVGRTTALGGMETTAARGSDPLPTMSVQNVDACVACSSHSDVLDILLLLVYYGILWHI